MVPPCVLVEDGMGGRRLARSFSRSAAAERLMNAIFTVMISELFQLSPQVDCIPEDPTCPRRILNPRKKRSGADSLVRCRHRATVHVQIAVDDEHKLIVASAVINDGNDTGQLHAMAMAAKAELGVDEITALADTGYFNGNELKVCEEDGIVAYVPQAKRSGRLEAKERFSHEAFTYDAAADVYRCPGDKLLIPSTGRRDNCGRIEIRYTSRKADCDACPLRPRCLAATKTPTRTVLPLGARGGAGAPSRADDERGRADAAARRDRRTPLRHP